MANTRRLLLNKREQVNASSTLSNHVTWFVAMTSASSIVFPLVRTHLHFVAVYIFSHVVFTNALPRVEEFFIKSVVKTILFDSSISQ